MRFEFFPEGDGCGVIECKFSLLFDDYELSGWKIMWTTKKMPRQRFVAVPSFRIGNGSYIRFIRFYRQDTFDSFQKLAISTWDKWKADRARKDNEIIAEKKGENNEAEKEA
jgi:hypothetical protein